ncbi:MAG: O-antigen ligase family protein [Clostridia bacterium]|nr:O-antigen ligase family protein [Clostridia bacterium]
MNDKLRRTINVILVIFLVVQPLCDIYMGVIGEKLDIFGISIVTFVRTITTVALVVTIGINQIACKYKIKWFVTLIGYLSIVGIYAICHHLNIVNSGGYYITQNLYNFSTELMYVLRLVVPIILMYVVIISKPKREHIEKAILISTIIIAIIIITTNIFKISYASYSPLNRFVEYNIFDWFKYDELPYTETLSKGLFVSANQIGALLVVLMPITLMYALKYNKITVYITLLLQEIAMILVGTRVATYGFVLCILAMIIGYVVISIIRKRKMHFARILAVICILALGLIIYKHSPSNSRTFASVNSSMYVEQEKDDKEEYITIEAYNEIISDEAKMREYLNAKKNKNITLDELMHRTMCKYIETNYRQHAVAKKYVMDIYPYEQDPEFWVVLFEQPISVKGDNRARQSVIIKRIKELNNNALNDTLVGMGATPMNQRGYMIENDLISHYYNIGVIGIILFVSPYALAVIYVVLAGVKHFKRLFNARIVAYSLSIFMMYVIGFFAGHTIDEYIITIYMAVMTGMLINTFNKEVRKEGK